ncbi:DEKNAAC104897 [Brettanomyces naardenensis]|uniref:Succinate-semialdehyde dehydrogenase n=1 Tax=Brettanomyces naardenensis TaxID=13370 RepID=A0A448YS21_BRENA|nr:DEKNAAC104897 [Brettanomyces naardenensis]
MSTPEQIKAFADQYGIKNVDLIQTGALINGKWLNDPKISFPVNDPAINKTILNVYDTPFEQVQQSVVDAEAAFRKFSKETTGRDRSVILRKIYDLITENTEDLARIVTAENGKPLADARGEVGYAASFFLWYSEEAPRIYGDVIPSASGSKKIITIKQPIGVVGILTPWNFPAAMITRKLGAAVAAGCTAVIKPASETPLTALAIAYLAQKAGLPNGVLNIFPTSHKQSRDVGKLVCTSPLIKKVSFTGSTGVGMTLMEQSASSLKKLSFELGGNAPFIVFDDADIDNAVDSAMACKLRQSGQTCVCANRLYIQDGIYDKFAAKLLEKVKATKLGNGMDPTTTHGPLIHDRAVAKVASQLEDAVSKGAKVLAGGKVAKELGPNFFELTIISDVPVDAVVNKDETFGPLVPLIKFSTEEQVLQLANDTEYGLAGYFFTRDYSRLFRVADELHCGMIGANTGAISEAALPFGGVNWSGFGREGSKYGVDDYIVIKSVVVGNL